MSSYNPKTAKNILFIPAWYPSETNPVSGIFIKEYAKAVSLKNEVLVLFAYSDPNPKFHLIPSKSEKIEDNIRTLRVKYALPSYFKKKGSNEKKKVNKSVASKDNDNKSSFSILSKIFYYVYILIYYFSIFNGFRKLLKDGWKPDIIHAHVFTAGVPAILLGKIYKIPVLITEHNTIFSKHNLSFWQRCQARYAMNRASAILPVSKGLMSVIQEYNIKNNFYVVPNVINNEIFYPPTKHIEHEKTKMLLVANISPQKGIDYLLDALNHLKKKRNDFELDIVGDGISKKEYEQMAKDLGLEKIVQFHGQKTKNEVAVYMRNCDFFVQPSLFETFGVVYIEAMACGKPVIGTKIIGPSEIITEDVGILIPPKDVNSLIDALDFMLDNYGNYSSEKISQYAYENFNYETIGTQLDEIYQNIISPPKKENF